jgi:hypothetical protein
MHGAAHRHRSRLIAIALLAVLTGCSAFSLAWNYVEGVLVDRVDAWTTLTAEQRTDLEQQLEPWLDRVAVERMPEYADYLRGAAKRTRTDLDAADVDWAYRRARTHYRALVADAIDSWVAPALTGLEPDQFDHLRTKMQRENAEYRARYIDVSRRESQRALAARIIDFVEGWTGPLNVQQTELLYRGVRDLPDTSLEWYRYRIRMQAGLLARLRSDANEPAVAAWLRGWWVERAALRPRDKAAFDRFEHELVGLLTEFAGTLTPMQRLALGRRLRGIADELETIHFQTIRGSARLPHQQHS